MKKVLKEIKINKEEYPLLPVQDVVFMPLMVAPLLITDEKNKCAVEAAMEADGDIFIVNQKNANYPEHIKDIYTFGTVAHIIQILRSPDGSLRLFVKGQNRATVKKIKKEHNFSFVQVLSENNDFEVDEKIIAMKATVLRAFSVYCKIIQVIPREVLAAAEKAKNANELTFIILANLKINKESKLEILSNENTVKRLESMAVIIEAEIEMLELQTKINTKVKEKLDKNQKDFFLHEKIKEINKELGRDKDDASEVDEILNTLKMKFAPVEVLRKAKKEGKRLIKLQPMSLESGILRTYLEWLSDLPWSECTQDNININKAAEILDEDHYGMTKPKERILDYIAVCQIKEKMKGPILCFVGPPGTGKTSLGKSVARALGRNFVRISLGGVRDEAEIRGHRKTYVGSLPGKIIQSIKKAGSSNPVFLLDEIDKIGSDFKGDPASALLEVLDPEQNNTFVDHYLEVPYDLSEVIFITTANSLHNIPYALRDRMEIIEIPGYTDIEKLKIATDFIIPKQKEENGLTKTQIKIDKSAILKIIHNYTMESGVRNLERQIGTILRKTAREALTKGIQIDNNYIKTITDKSLKKLLGKEVFQNDLVYAESRSGLVHGLAWTEMGGTLLPIEVALIEDKGEMILTGKLGDVMKESAKTALSYIKSNYKSFGLEKNVFENKLVHIHVPEGAIPKDGPSAGITIVLALVSIFKDTPPKPKFAMTGEITLTGRVLPIGGLKEKTLAAYRNKMTDVIVPEGNRKDYDELPTEVKKSLNFHFVKNIQETYPILFE